MTVKDIQRRHTTIFNVRFGEKINDRPAKLKDKLRITSPNKSVVEAFAARYGGEPRPWEDGFEVYLPRADLPIVLLPGQSITQWWTLYKGSVCERRCDGEIEQLSKKPCMCPEDLEQRIADRYSCSLETRLNFICPEVAVMGAGALVTRSIIGGETLPQSVQIAERALEMGQMVPATLRAVQKVGKGRQYVIPQIEITGLSLNELMSGELSGGGSGGPALASASAPSLPAAGRPGGTDEDVAQRALAPVETDTAVQGRDRPTSSTTGPASTAAKATGAQRDSIRRQAIKKGVDDAQLEELILDKTSKYLDEADFSVEDLNVVLGAIADL